MNELLAEERIYLPDGKFVIFSPGYHLSFDANFNVNWFSQGFIRSPHTVAVYSPYDNAYGQVSIYSGAPSSVPETATRVFEIPIALDAERMQFDGDIEDYYGEIGVPLPSGNYLMTIVQTDLKEFDENNAPQLKFDVYIRSCEHGAKGKTLIADDLIVAGEEFAEIQGDSYSEQL